MKRLPLFILFIFLGTLLGCMKGLSPEDIAMTNAQFKAFQEQYPNGELRVVHLSQEQAQTLLSEIKADCGDHMVPKEYYKVTMTDAASKLSMVAYIDLQTKITECIFKSGGQASPTNNASNTTTNEEIQEPAEPAKKYDLSDYPAPFVQKGIYNAVIVVGNNAPAEDIVSAIDLAASLGYAIIQTAPKSTTTETPTNDGGIEKINVGAAKLASEVSDVNAQNIISIGNGCNNEATLKLLGLQFSDCYGTLVSGKAIIRTLNKGGHTALVIAGYNPDDTQRAERVLADYLSYKDSLIGNTLEITGSSLTDINVNPLTGRTPAGNDLLELSFLPDAPPDRVYDGGVYPFDIVVAIKNIGRYDFSKNTCYVELSGIDVTEFGKNNVDFKKFIDKEILIQDVVYVEFNNLNYKGSLSGNTVFPIRVDLNCDVPGDSFKNTVETTMLVMHSSNINSPSTDETTV